MEESKKRSGKAEAEKAETEKKEKTETDKTETESKNPYLELADYSWSTDSIRYVNTSAQSVRNTFFYVQEVGDFVTQPPYFTERKNLDSFLIIYTRNGRGKLNYKGHVYRLLPGSVAFIHCVEHHRYQIDSDKKDEKWEFLWLHFNGPSARGYYEEFQKSGFHILEGMDNFFIERTMRRILSLTIKKDLHSELIVSGLIVELMTEFIIKNSSESLSIGRMPLYLRQSVKEIEARFLDPLSLDDLSKQVGVSKYHLSREFKRYIGSTVNEYVILKRINHAKELLKYTDLSVEEVAYSSGFHQVSYFIMQFKKHENNTPLQYRMNGI